MRAGRLRHRLELQSKTETRAADGGITETWSTDATIWGEIKPLSGREFMEAQAVNADMTHDITIRHREGITNSNRFKFGTRAYHPVSVVNWFERDKFLLIKCKEDLC